MFNGGGTAESTIPLSVSLIQWLGGGSTAVTLLVQLLKRMPYIWKIPTRLLDALMGEVIVFWTATPPNSLGTCIVLFLNGILISSMAVGAWHIASSAVNTIQREGSTNGPDK